MDIEYDNEQKIQELVTKFEETHLIYLQIDDSPQKLEQRRKLEGYIEQYLCLVPNEQKYIFKETSKILNISASCKEFSGYKASNGWSAISLYASNLFSQPWRKEYKKINTYSGYYQHELVANLLGAEMMFRIMGYKNDGCGTLSLRGPIDPDEVSNVSRDAIVAFVECKIMKQIWENVTIRYNIPWSDILEFRKNFTGTAEQAIRALNYQNYIYSQAYLNYNPLKRGYETDFHNVKRDELFFNGVHETNNEFKQKYSDDLIEDSPQDTLLHLVPRPENPMQKGIRRSLTKKNVNNINLNTCRYLNKSDEELEVVDTSNTFDVEKEWNVLNSSKAECISIKNVDNVNCIPNEDINTWNCVTCTFLNTESNTICQMCSKSRFQNVEHESVISDGKQCKHCTLINKKNVLVCEACGISFNNVTLES